MTSRFSGVMSEFASCRRPWNEYITLLTRADTTPYATEKPEYPKYRGDFVGKEGLLMKEAVHLHYSQFPDERMFSSLNRWRQGDAVGDIAWQQFRSAQPHPLADHNDPDGFSVPEPEEYLKLNYKNPKVFCKYLTRAGTYYPRDVLKLSPEAHRKLQNARVQARTLGLFPKNGNPFWHRLQKNKPKVYQMQYDPIGASTKSTMEQFCFHWLQTDRIQRYFQQREKERQEGGQRLSLRPMTAMMSSGYESRSREERMDVEKQPRGGLVRQGQETSTKDSQVPGLMSTKGLRRNPFLYARTTKRRTGFNSFDIKDI